MACGDKYKHLLSASGGRTVDSPFEYWCNEPDAEAWYGQATHVHRLQVEAWNALMKLENERGAWPQTDKLRPSAEAYDAGYEALPEPSAWMAFGMAGCAEAIQEMIGNLRQGVCVLEELNDAIEGYGAKGIDPGAAAGTGGVHWGWWVGGALLLVGVGAGAYVYATRPRQPARGGTTVVLGGSSSARSLPPARKNGRDEKRNGNGRRSA